MESENIQCRDPDLEESFSFSHHSSSSSPLAIFSDSDADDDYFEIALQPAHLRQSNFDGDEEMELRISFSTSCVPFLDDVKTTTESYMTSCKSSSSSSSSSSTFTFSSSSESQRKLPEEYSRLDESKAGNRFVDTFIKVSKSEIDDRSTEISNLELVPSSGTRKASKLTTTKMNSSFMMKFFIKFRETLKLKTVLASFLKASQANGSLYKDKLCDETFLACNNRTIIEKGSSAAGKNNKLELNFDAVKGILLEAMNISTSRGRGRKDRRAKSCPVSTKSSPLHQKFGNDNCKISATDNNSIQAAIAHCKRSFHPNI